MTAERRDRTARDLVVIGAGRGAGDIADLVGCLQARGAARRLRGFLDDDPDMHGALIAGHPVLAALDAAAALGEVDFIIGIANYRQPKIRLQVAARLALSASRFASLVHPGASISPAARIGHGCLIFQGAIVGHETVIGDHAFIGPGAMVSHHTVVEPGAIVALGAVMCSGAVLGAGAYLGARSVVRDGARVGSGALVGIGSVVLRDVPDDRVVLGSPARIVRDTSGASR